IGSQRSPADSNIATRCDGRTQATERVFSRIDGYFDSLFRLPAVADAGNDDRIIGTTCQAAGDRVDYVGGASAGRRAAIGKPVAVGVVRAPVSVLFHREQGKLDGSSG